jgi:phosphonoacetaldehyde hydrolase
MRTQVKTEAAVSICGRSFSFLRAAVLDWSGTVLDFGCRAPIGAFIAAFKRFDVDITAAEARAPMGIPKREHIVAIVGVPRVAAAWREVHGRAAMEADLDAILEEYIRVNGKVIADYSELIPGTLETVTAMRTRGLKIGSTTGYPRVIMEQLAPIARAAGYEPDNLVCAGDLAAGRPTPLMMYRTFADLGLFPPSAVIKVDDTGPGIAEGLAAGTWAVGLSVSGNAFGASLEEIAALPAADYAARRAASGKQLSDAGAHYIIDTIADLMPIADEIESRLASGHLPSKAQEKLP